MENKFEDGVHAISNDMYHGSQGVSRSALWTFRKSAALYEYEYLNPHYEKPDQTPAMVMGDMLHCLALEPQEYEKRYILAPKVDRRTKQGKADWVEFQTVAGNKTIITNDQLLQASKMHTRLQTNDTFLALLDGAKVEQSIYFTHERTGIQCKVRPDIWNKNIVADLKTTESASPRDFQSSAYRYGYYLQAAMIHEALRSLDIKMDKFVFVCIEKKEPNLEALYVLEQDALDFGITLFNKLMDDYAECLDKNEWPGYGIQTITTPAYAQYED